MSLVTLKGFAQVNPDGPDYVVLYIETANYDRVADLTTELESYENKVISAVYSKYTHELTVHYTPLMRDDTIYHIVFKYFEKVKKVAGTHITSNQ